jgi:diguanylate cyclase (GGDEF)-like protein
MANRCMKLLLVEDQKSDLLSVQRALAQVPNIAFELKNVETIAKAQAILTEEDFDAVLVDVHLPDGTALEIIQHVRTMPTHTPVIVFTGDERRATDLAVMEAGADDFLLKSDLRPELLDRSVRYAVERSRLLRDMKYKARYDSLTCIPNREYFNEFLQHAVSRAHRDDDRLAVLYVDLDRFKEVNDELGHTAGDTLLMSVAERTLSCVRSGDLVARLAGDEFAICLNNIRHPEDAARVAAKLIDVLRNPHTLGAHRVSASPSVGIATYPEVGGSVDGLMSAADTAMYAAKRAGGATFRYFSQDMQDKALARHRMEHDLGAALGLDQFELFAQPQVNAASRQLVGLETLLRWRRDPRELVLPGDFIPLAEETGLIVPIGAWTLRASCLLVRRWAASGVLPEDFSVAVNVSARELLAGRLLRDIERALDDAAVAPNRR